ncbi:MAG: hypothetical protein AB8H79_02475 [Myxococcota bacterium]
MQDVPQNYKTAAILMLIAGIMNLLQSLSMGLICVIYGIMTFGICCVGCVFPVLNIAAGIAEIVTASKMMKGEAVPSAPQVSIGGIVCGALGLALLPMILEIIATVMLNDDEVKIFLANNAPDPDLLT